MRGYVVAILLAGCARVTAPANPAEVVMEQNERSLRLNPAEMRYDDAEGLVIFEPDRGLQRAKYETFVLDLASLEVALGGRPTAVVDVVIEITETEQVTTSPSDPYMAAPEGGFEVVTQRGRVVRRG